MNEMHPSADQLDRYRRRAASPAETMAVDAHVAACDRCFQGVRADSHLTFEELAAIADGTAPASPHVALCSVCRGEVDDLRRMRAAIGDARAPRRRWPLAAAAILALLLLGAAWLLMRTGARPPDRVTPPVAQTAPVTATPAEQPPPPVVALERPQILDTLLTERAVLRGNGTGAAFALHAPVATVVLDDRPPFRWAAVPDATSYEVTVLDLDRGIVIASGTSTANTWRPAAPLPRGRTYLWQVAAATPRGRVVSPGPAGAEARFHVSASARIDGATPRDRGVAMANLGALDAAERELDSAGATELLQQVRAWRQNYRARPTTTNGAQ